MSVHETALACGRKLMIATALSMALTWVAGVERASAQLGPPPGPPQQQDPFSSFSPFPPPMPPVQAAPPVGQPAVRANEERRVVRPYRARRKVVERKPAPPVAKKERVPSRELAKREAAKREVVKREVVKRDKIAKRKPIPRKPAASSENQRELAESRGYKRVSDLVNFPKFFPGLGVIYVRPDTLPAGPYLCFDRDDRLVATVYMMSIKDIDDHKTVEASSINAPVDHVSLYFNAGHPGMDMPHYHFVMWHVSRKDEARVAQ